MVYLHTMLRVADLDAALEFFCGGLGLCEVRRTESERGRFTLVFLASPEDLRAKDAAAAAGVPAELPCLELTFNWDPEVYTGGRNFGHVAFGVDDIYATCAHLSARGVRILRPPRDGRMAFVRSPDGISIELLQRGDALAPEEPWASMPSEGTW
jgi:lactoylglutathione lyase